jgi:hypothetical protein
VGLAAFFFFFFFGIARWNEMWLEVEVEVLRESMVGVGVFVFECPVCRGKGTSLGIGISIIGATSGKDGSLADDPLPPFFCSFLGLSVVGTTEMELFITTPPITPDHDIRSSTGSSFDILRSVFRQL